MYISNVHVFLLRILARYELKWVCSFTLTGSISLLFHYLYKQSHVSTSNSSIQTHGRSWFEAWCYIEGPRFMQLVYAKFIYDYDRLSCTRHLGKMFLLQKWPVLNTISLGELDKGYSFGIPRGGMEHSPTNTVNLTPAFYLLRKCSIATHLYFCLPFGPPLGSHMEKMVGDQFLHWLIRL